MSINLAENILIIRLETDSPPEHIVVVHDENKRVSFIKTVYDDFIARFNNPDMKKLIYTVLMDNGLFTENIDIAGFFRQDDGSVEIKIRDSTHKFYGKIDAGIIEEINKVYNYLCDKFNIQSDDANISSLLPPQVNNAPISKNTEGGWRLAIIILFILIAIGAVVYKYMG
jgi:hypothetical protein